MGAIAGLDHRDLMRAGDIKSPDAGLKTGAGKVPIQKVEPPIGADICARG
jgi:hypothetical protein